MSAADPAPGPRGAVLGDYELGAKIGEGSMGTVYRGTDLVHDRPVAIKFLTQLAESPHALARFQREVQVALKMRHDNIVRGYAAGVWEGCIHYFVMEYVDGVTLTEYMARERMTEAKAVDVTCQIARALLHIHEFGLVHRDIKPENVMLTRDHVAKLTDLGLAKAADSDTELTLAGAIVGTPLYMSPEQGRGIADLDIRSDLYSLGATFYHLLTGGPPFKGQSAPEVIARQIREEPVAPREIDPGISVGAQYVTLKLLRKDPGARYQSPEALIQDLELLAAGKGHAGEPDTPWAADAAPAGERWPAAFAPPEEDVRFGLAAISNQMLDRAALATCLDEQEALARGGFGLKISYLASERGLLAAAQVKRIEAALRDRADSEREGLFGKLALRHKVVTETQLAECLAEQETRRTEGRPLRIAELLQQKGYATAEQIDRCLAAQRRARHGKEDEEVLALACAEGLVSPGQSERAKLIHRNQSVMGSYQPIGDVCVERRYLAPEARDALVRAVRRARLLDQPAAEILAAHRADGAARAAAPAERLAAFQARIAAHLEKGRALRKAYRYYEAITEWERVLEILSSHPEAERLIEETRSLVGDLEARKQRGAKMLAAALAEWDYYRRLNPVDGSLRDVVAEANARLLRLDGTGGKPGTGRTTARPRTPTPAPARPERPSDSEGVERAPTEPEGHAPIPDAARVERVLRQAERAEEAGRLAEAEARFGEALAEAPDSPAAIHGLDRVARRRQWRSLGWAVGALVVLAGAVASTIAVVGWIPVAAWAFRLLGGLS